MGIRLAGLRRAVVFLVLLVGITIVAAFALPGWAPVLAGFVLGVIGAGAGAVVQTIVVEDRRRAATLRALMSEVEENIERCGPADRSHAPATMERSAWNLARELALPAAVLEKLRRAHAAGADLNSRIGIQDAFAATPVIVEPNPEAPRARSAQAKLLSDDTLDTAGKVRLAFEAARDALKPLV
jgi:hypothetical protein